MSTPQPTPVTFNAHQKHWYDIFDIVMQSVKAANPIIATIIPAPIEAGIQVAIATAPIVEGVGAAVGAAAGAGAQ